MKLSGANVSRFLFQQGFPRKGSVGGKGGFSVSQRGGAHCFGVRVPPTVMVEMVYRGKPDAAVETADLERLRQALTGHWQATVITGRFGCRFILVSEKETR